MDKKAQKFIGRNNVYKLDLRSKIIVKHNQLSTEGLQFWKFNFNL